MTLYNMRTNDGDYRVTKFDDDLNVISSYLVSEEACTCPAGQRPSCRHRQMLPYFHAAEAIDKPMYFDYDGDHGWYTLGDSTDEAESSEDNISPDERLAIALNEAHPTNLISEVEAVAGDDAIMGFAKELDKIDAGEALFNELAKIEGVSVLNLNDIGAVHSAIAEAVGEPPVEVERVAASEPQVEPETFKRRF